MSLYEFRKLGDKIKLTFRKRYTEETGKSPVYQGLYTKLFEKWLEEAGH